MHFEYGTELYCVLQIQHVFLACYKKLFVIFLGLYEFYFRWPDEKSALLGLQISRS